MKRTWKNEYDLMLKLYLEISECAYLCGNYSDMNRFINATLKNANNLLDRIEVYALKIKALFVQEKADEAINEAIEILNQLGIKLHANPKYI